MVIFGLFLKDIAKKQKIDMKKVFSVYGHTKGGQSIWEGDFSSYEEADGYIMETLAKQYGPTSKQDTLSPIVRFNIQIDYVLPKE